MGARVKSKKIRRDQRPFVGIGREIKKRYLAAHLETLLNRGCGSKTVDTDEPIAGPSQQRTPSPPPVPAHIPVQVFPAVPKRTAIPIHSRWDALLPRLEAPFSQYQRDTRGHVQPIVPDTINYRCSISCDSPLTLEVHCLYPTHCKMVQLTTCARCMPAPILLVQHGLFPATPTKPRTAVSIDLLDLHRALSETFFKLRLYHSTRSCTTYNLRPARVPRIFTTGTYTLHILLTAKHIPSQNPGTPAVDPFRNALSSAVLWFSRLQTRVDASASPTHQESPPPVAQPPPPVVAPPSVAAPPTFTPDQVQAFFAFMSTFTAGSN
ncbi:hypothetical protein B0H12DRAFT_1232870 [Mycena haematopus]|nr:hypothetical protein B0H12DRAFT_1232870 [Mycena haematopus]